jgi:RimJ/RimL family protein N-acetyltransferase
MSDAHNLLRWKNDPDTRRNAILTDAEIKWEDHKRWLEARLSDPLTELYVITNGSADYGDIRLDVGEKTEVSTRIDQAFRGLGLGSLAVQQVLNGRSVGGCYLARIVEGNLASMKIFLRNGFEFVSYEHGGRKNYYVLERVL